MWVSRTKLVLRVIILLLINFSLYWNGRGFGNSDAKIKMQKCWFQFRNRWHNVLSLGIQVLSSHIFREGIYCAVRLATLGHLVHIGCHFYLLICNQSFIWTVAESLGLDFRRRLSLLFFALIFCCFAFLFSRVLA